MGCEKNIYFNPHIQSLNWESLRWMWTDCDYTPRYRPLNWFSWALLYHFFGADGRPYHAVTLLLHTANSILVFFLICKILSFVKRPGDANVLLLISWVGALLWAVHPLRVEVVGWANCQIYTQSLFFLLLALGAYLRAVEHARPPKTTAYWLAVFFLTLAMLTYPTGIGFVVVLLVLDVLLLQRLGLRTSIWLQPSCRKVWVEKVPFVVVTLILAGVTVWTRVSQTGHWAMISSQEGFGLASRAAQAFYVWAYYLWKPWMPFNLSPVYTTLVSFHPFEPRFLVSVMVVLSVTGILLWKARQWPGLLGLWICYLALLVPMLGLFEHPHYPSDRYSYIVGIVWSLVISGVLAKIEGAKPRLVAITLALIVAGPLSIASHKQSKMWRNSVVLFETTITRLGEDPYRADVYARLGRFYLNTGKFAGALQAYTKCLALAPEWPNVHAELGETLFNMGRIAEGKAYYFHAIQNAPNDSDVRNRFAVDLAVKGDFAGAMEQFKEALRSAPESASVHQNIGLLLQKQGNRNEAEAYFQKAAQLRQRHP